MKNLHTEILINASKETIWEVLMAFENYSEWNPFIQSVSGNPLQGEMLHVSMTIGDQKQAFKPEVLNIQQWKEFRWKGKLWIKGLFDGEHYFLLEELNEQQIRFVQGERFSGLLVGPIMKAIGQQTRMNFEKMNEALKNRAEQLQKEDALKSV